MNLSPSPSSSTAASTSKYTLQTTPFYGILTTQRSHHLALRSLSSSHHAHYLAHRTCTPHLPAELRDLIAAELHHLLTTATKQKWERMKHNPTTRAREFKFPENPAERTWAEEAGWQRYVLLARAGGGEGTEITAMEVEVSLSGSGEEGREQRYVHLSACRARPNLTMLVPGGAVASSGGPGVTFANGRVVVEVKPGSSPGLPGCEVVRVVGGVGGGGEVKRLVQLDDVRASIKGWDGEVMAGFVRELGLRVVSVEGEESGLEPRLRLLQGLTWE